MCPGLDVQAARAKSRDLGGSSCPTQAGCPFLLVLETPEPTHDRSGRKGLRKTAENKGCPGCFSLENQSKRSLALWQKFMLYVSDRQGTVSTPWLGVRSADSQPLSCRIRTVLCLRPSGMGEGIRVPRRKGRLLSSPTRVEEKGKHVI